jgi:hypothetical protein
MAYSAELVIDIETVMKSLGFFCVPHAAKQKERTTPLGIEPRISGSVDQRLIHWATESCWC